MEFEDIMMMYEDELPDDIYEEMQNMTDISNSADIRYDRLIKDIITAVKNGDMDEEIGDEIINLIKEKR